MGLKICSLSSGSTGNCIYVASEQTSVIIDCGVPFRRVDRSLKVLKAGGDFAVLITHTHSDHVSGVPVLAKNLECPVYTHFLSAGLKHRLGESSRRMSEFGDGDFYVGDLLISPVRVSHDVPTVGYQIHNGGKKISVLTDLGTIDSRIIKAISDSDIVFLESNHDEELVKANKNYSFVLKRRILSDSGHLSNAACGNAVALLAEAGVKQVILGHLSRENNYPELAFGTVANILSEKGITEGVDIKIEVAPAESLSGLYEVC